MNRKLKKYFIIAAVIILIGVLIFWIIPSGRKPTITLTTSKAEIGDISTTVTATGTVEPIVLVEVGTQVSGVISKIYVDYNSEVKEGQILAELDKRLLNSELENANATLHTRQVELELQKKNYDRYKMLWERQAISKVDWENVETAYKTAEYSVTASKAAVFKAQTNLGYATIYSTIDGVVISRAVEEGQTVAASFSTPTLFTIANDLTKMRVIANVDEADIGGVEEGQRVTFSVDAYPDDEFEGTVVQVRLEATTTSNVVTYEVVIDAPNPDLKLKPGLTANVNIYTLEEKGVLIIPSKALRFIPNPDILKNIEGLEIDEKPVVDSKNKIVWIKTGDKIQPRVVTVGATDAVDISVTSGLNVGDEVVTGVAQAVNAPEENGSNGESSPFMPQRPGGRR